MQSTRVCFVPSVSLSFAAGEFQIYFSKDSQISESARLYSGVQFRSGMTLIMEDDTFIGTGALILAPKLVMKRGSQINAGAILAGKEPVILEENVVISYGAKIITASDTGASALMNDATPENERSIRRGMVKIGKNSFIGANAVVMPKVRIGPNCIIGSGAYIDKNVRAKTRVIPKQELTIKDREII